MIHKLEVRNFKRFRDATFELDDQLVIVGSNNCGKTTMLQAIALWAEAWGHWSQDDAASAWLRSSSSEVRTSADSYVATTLETIQSVAVTDFAHLWHDKNVREPIVLDMHARTWKVALELHFKTSRTIAVRPADSVRGRELRTCNLKVRLPSHTFRLRCASRKRNRSSRRMCCGLGCREAVAPAY